MGLSCPQTGRPPATRATLVRRPHRLSEYLLTELYLIGPDHQRIAKLDRLNEVSVDPLESSMIRSPLIIGRAATEGFALSRQGAWPAFHILFVLNTD